MRHFLLLSTILLLLLPACQQEERISFNDDVRPIFNAKCVGCHGGVKQAGELGLIFRENALASIVPGKPQRSELIHRVRHDNPELRMPYEAEPLSEAEIVTLERWIAQGAEWEEHWAYLPPRLAAPRSAVPEGGNPIDAFVADGLGDLPIDFAPAAAPTTLLRRLSFDLTGLPPTPGAVERYADQPTDRAYRDVVDQYLASPRYGEHRAAAWLDLARYADSRGYERDRPRTIWPYRDWVIRAFNEDMPFDRFTVEQLAGDLLPDPTRDQLIATAFHRNTPSNGEGGTENEEYRVVSVIDRVNTSWEVWQGTSMACVQCHSHPYDPIEHTAFYDSYAFFNNTADHDHVWERPAVSVPSEATRRRVDSLRAWVVEYGTPAEAKQWKRYLDTREPVVRPYHFEDNRGGVFTDRADEDFMVMRGGTSFALPATDYTGVSGLLFDGMVHEPTVVELRLDAVDGPLITTTELAKSRGDKVLFPVEISGKHRVYMVFLGESDKKCVSVYSLYALPELPGREAADHGKLVAYLEGLINTPDSLQVPVMSENPARLARTTHLFERGNWLVHGQELTGGVPAIMPPLPEGEPTDRLAFARWLVAPDNPLTARVTVNRIWGELFGRGLVSTPEDFGSQGAKPSHPELLDWLAVQFATEMQWSVKELIRTIVTSRTYRQSSQASEELRELDPYNDLLARGPRSRLTAEQLRDQMLAVSGLLSDKMYGPGVMPPQPEGLWDHIPYSNERWETSDGEDRYRRAVYTYLRRSVLHPTMTTFDGSNREVCLSQRTETNTPLQALATLNDPAFAEGMRKIATDVLAQTSEPAVAIDRIYQRLLYQRVREGDREALLGLYEDALRAYDGRQEDALFLVVNVLFNLDEFLTKS